MNRARTAKVLMLDNYDSFTFNLVHYFEQLDVEIIVKRNDATSVEDVEQVAPSHIVISPGPCDPSKAGISLSLINQFKAKIPILGVCLGHQAIAQAFGGQIIQAKQPVHGKTSMIFHQQTGVYRTINDPFAAVRYHSLVVERKSLPDCFEITAWTQLSNGELDEIMGIKHRDLPIEGIQFHPESVLSKHGLELLSNFLFA